MRNRFREALIAIVTAVVVGGLASSMTRTAGQTAGGPGAASTAHGRRETRLQRSLAGQQRRELGSADPCRASDGGSARRLQGRAGAGRAGRGAGRDRLGAARYRRGRGRRDSVPAVGGEAEEGELRQLARPRSGDRVLPAGRAARHVHAVQVPDHSGHEQDHDGLRVRRRRAHTSSGRGRTLSGGSLHGTLRREVGRRHAGRRRVELHGADVVRPGRKLPQRRASRDRTVHADSAATRSATKPRSKIRRCSPAPGRSACRSIGGSNRTRS